MDTTEYKASEQKESNGHKNNEFAELQAQIEEVKAKVEAATYAIVKFHLQRRLAMLLDRLATMKETAGLDQETSDTENTDGSLYDVDEEKLLALKHAELRCILIPVVESFLREKQGKQQKVAEEINAATDADSPSTTGADASISEPAMGDKASSNYQQTPNHPVNLRGIFKGNIWFGEETNLLADDELACLIAECDGSWVVH